MTHLLDFGIQRPWKALLEIGHAIYAGLQSVLENFGPLDLYPLQING